MMTIRRELYQLSYYTEGTIPDMMVTCPEDWPPQQVADFQTSFDFLMQGKEYFGFVDLEFVFTHEEQLDQLKEMQTLTGYVGESHHEARRSARKARHAGNGRPG